MIIDSRKQISDLKDEIYQNLMRTYEYLNEKMLANSAIELFINMKFNQSGLDPIKGTPLNFIEQLNQTFSDLVVLYAVEMLINKYSDKTFEVNFGPNAGFDIESQDKTVVAECFAVTNVSSNNKLRKDAKKLLDIAQNAEKYIYFYSENDSEEKLERIYKQFPEIIFQRIKTF